jgi:hypothetical protein
MSLAAIVRQTRPSDVEEFEEKKDVRGLISLLSSEDYRIRDRAADALGRIGAPALSVLNTRATRGSVETRLGLVEAIARIRSPQSVPVLCRILSKDENSEVRWIAAIALGESGDKSAIPVLIRALKDRDKFVRFGAAQVLRNMEWRPENPEDDVRVQIALQNWSAIPGIPGVPIDIVTEYLGDADPRIRSSVVSLLGILGDPRAGEACDRAMRDPDPEVRWIATRAFPRCQVSDLLLPAGMFRRVRTGKSLFGAMLLNFFFPGLGYNYLGKWWGFLLFQIMFTGLILVSFSLFEGNLFSAYPLLFPFSSVAVAHTYYLGRKIPDI